MDARGVSAVAASADARLTKPHNEIQPCCCRRRNKPQYCTGPLNRTLSVRAPRDARFTPRPGRLKGRRIYPMSSFTCRKLDGSCFIRVTGLTRRYSSICNCPSLVARLFAVSSEFCSFFLEDILELSHTSRINQCLRSLARNFSGKNKSLFLLLFSHRMPYLPLVSFPVSHPDLRSALLINKIGLKWLQGENLSELKKELPKPLTTGSLTRSPVQAQLVEMDRQSGWARPRKCNSQHCLFSFRQPW
jgi:hypothetical protein